MVIGSPDEAHSKPLPRGPLHQAIASVALVACCSHRRCGPVNLLARHADSGRVRPPAPRAQYMLGVRVGMVWGGRGSLSDFDGVFT